METLQLKNVRIKEIKYKEDVNVVAFRNNDNNTSIPRLKEKEIKALLEIASLEADGIMSVDIAMAKRDAGRRVIEREKFTFKYYKKVLMRKNIYGELSVVNTMEKFIEGGIWYDKNEEIISPRFDNEGNKCGEKEFRNGFWYDFHQYDDNNNNNPTGNGTGLFPAWEADGFED